MSSRLLALLILAGVLVVILICATVLYATHADFPEAAFGNIASAVLGAIIVLATRFATNGNGKGP